jgi:hypothetical protein
MRNSERQDINNIVDFRLVIGDWFVIVDRGFEVEWEIETQNSQTGIRPDWTGNCANWAWEVGGWEPNSGVPLKNPSVLPFHAERCS